MSLPHSEHLMKLVTLRRNSTSQDVAQNSLVDRFGRVHSSLRVSVTDRCNIRCRYCMPGGDVAFMPTERWLSFDSIARLVRTLSKVGIRKIRITGGEPLMRPKLHELIRMIGDLGSIEDLALTTNGMLLADQADALKRAGLMRINISLDTLQEETFFNISRRQGVSKVLEGIEAALDQRFDVRLNAMVLRDMNLDEVTSLVSFARSRNLPIRFIEFMPLDADREWNQERMVSGKELRERLSKEFGRLLPESRTDQSQPATDYRFEDGKGVVGFIDTVTQPFCSGCNRLRLTADGILRNCLFGKEGWDIGPLVQEGCNEAQILDVVRDCVAKKHAAHGISEAGFQPPALAMYQIGG